MCMDWAAALPAGERERLARRAGTVADDLHGLSTRFLAGALRGEEWTHENHVRIGLYLRWLLGHDAFYAFRRGVEATNAALGLGDRFHYTVTFAYMLIFGHVIDADPDRPVADLVADVLRSRLADRGLIWRLYSPDTLATEVARRRQFVQPRRPIDAALVGEWLAERVEEPVLVEA